MSNRAWKKDLSLIYESKIYSESGDESSYELQAQLTTDVITRMLMEPEVYGDRLVRTPTEDLSMALTQRMDPETKEAVLNKLQDFLEAGGNPRLRNKIIELSNIIARLEGQMSDMAMVSDFDPEKNE
jgi:hypothetical protein